MALRTIASRINQVASRALTNPYTVRTIASYPSLSRRQNYTRAPQSRVRFFSTRPAAASTSSVTDLLRTCVSQQLGLEAILPAKSVLASLNTQTALTWTSEDLINLAVALCRTSKSYDRAGVWQALAPLVTAVTPSLTVDEISKLMWSLQSLPVSSMGQKWLHDMLFAINSVVEESAPDAWSEEKLAMAVYCVPALNCRSTQVKALLRSLKVKVRSVRAGDGADAMFVAMHLLQNVDMNVREVIDLYAALLEKHTTIQGTTPFHISRELSKSPYTVPTSKDEVRKQWSVVNSVDANITLDALYASHGVGLQQDSADELRYVLYTGLGRERDQALRSLPAEPRLTGTSQDVHSVLRRVHERIGKTTAPSNARALGMSLYGLQQLTTDVKHVRELLNVSARQLTDSTTDLYVEELQLALQGSPAPTRKLRKPSSTTGKPSNT